MKIVNFFVGIIFLSHLLHAQPKGLPKSPHEYMMVFDSVLVHHHFVGVF
jgi:hypothetical protein